MLRHQLTQRLEIFLHFDQGAFVFLLGERQLELIFFFFFYFSELFASAFYRETFGVEEPLDIEQEFDVAFLVEAVFRRRLGGLEQIELGFPVA